MNTTTPDTSPRLLRACARLRSTRSKILILALMSGSVFIQPVDNDSLFKLKAAAAVVGVAVTGVAVWRMTAPSDKDILVDINDALLRKDLQKYNQVSDLILNHRKTEEEIGEQEEDLLKNLTKQLNYRDQYQEQETIQKNLDTDAQELKKLKETIWFRSFFNSGVAQKYNEIDASRSQARDLKIYFRSHDNFFKGSTICKEHKEVTKNALLEQDFVRGIRKNYLGRQVYPLIYVAAKYIQDVQWIKSLKKGVYPELEDELDVVCTNAQDSILALQDHPDYAKEQKNKAEQDVTSVQGMYAQAQLLSVQTAAQQASLAAQNLVVEQQRIAFEKERNERERVQARVEELKRYNYSDLAIQQQLNRDAIINKIMGWFC